MPIRGANSQFERLTRIAVWFSWMPKEGRFDDTRAFQKMSATIETCLAAFFQSNLNDLLVLLDARNKKIA
jgi:hypothetical protein